MGNGQSLKDWDPNECANDEDLDLFPMNYPNFGNYRLNQVPLKDLVKESLEYQRSFSDAICRRYAKNKKFLAMQQLAISNQGPIDIGQLNETSIGNYAFIIYHNPDDPFWQQQYDQTVKLILSRN